MLSILQSNYTDRPSVHEAILENKSQQIPWIHSELPYYKSEEDTAECVYMRDLSFMYSHLVGSLHKRACIVILTSL